MTWLWLVLIAIGLCGPVYALLMAGRSAISTQHRPLHGPPAHTICLVPCLNEGAVIKETTRELLALDKDLEVVIVDDASDDATPQILESLSGQRVHVVRRELPDARLGKGDALNHGLEFISEMVEERGLNSQRVIVAVFDADGKADPETLRAVRPWFAEPDVGAVQIGVRIRNRRTSLLARMQDIEFVVFTEIFQRARNDITSTGLGGNGQFVRLSALESLGAAPWSASLTEDLDLGIRLRLAGWRSVFEKSVSVHQEGLENPRRLVRQRTRWFQGHMQAWHLLPNIWRSRVPVSAKCDLSIHLVLPVLLLLASVGILAALVGVIAGLLTPPAATLAVLGSGPITPWWYVLGFLITPLVALIYWRTEQATGFARGILYAHLYTLFTWVWFVAGWRATVRQLKADLGWDKTARLSEPAPAAVGRRDDSAR